MFWFLFRSQKKAEKRGSPKSITRSIIALTILTIVVWRLDECRKDFQRNQSTYIRQAVVRLMLN